MDTTITASQKVRASIVVKDAGGNVIPGATVSNPNWGGLNNSIATVTPDGQEATITAVGPVGAMDVVLNTSNFQPVFAHVTVTPGDPASVEIVFGAPEPK